MTKTGFKSVTIPDYLYCIIINEAKNQQTSISKYLDGVLKGSYPLTLNPTAVGSNPSQPASDFSDNYSRELR